MGANSHQITEQFEKVSLQILTDARTQLYVSMRYLDLALSALRFTVTTEFAGIGTDGQRLIVHPKILADLFEKNSLLVNRVYLHTVLHCLLRHLIKRKRRKEVLWRLSCDIAVESIVDSMRVRSVRMGVSRLRMNTYQMLCTQLNVLTAEGIYRVLSGQSLSPFDVSSLISEYCIDNHSLWPAPGQDQPSVPQIEMLRNKWQEISEKIVTRMETFASDAAAGGGDLLDELKVENRDRYDYRSFLRKFAVLREEVQVDPDTFDYVFYTFGLNMYGNMPLIEPQEFREVNKIEEFVIVIDVSMSTSGELVRQFLEQTYSVLTESESYLRRIHIRILQADEKIVADRKITSREELDDYMEHFELLGGGGTDFRPAFDYVRELVAQKAFYHLKGMIYFTDGKGIYPSRKPEWETAFVFMDKPEVQVPPWAIRLVIEPEDLLEEKEQKLRMDYTFLDYAAEVDDGRW